MSLADRVRAALWANLNGIVSKLEQAGNDVPCLLDQMGQEINRAKRELLRAMSEEKVLRERSNTRAAEARKWQSRAELAVRAAKDDLARDALAQARRLQGESARDSAAADEYGALAQAMRADMAQMEMKHRDWSARQDTLGTKVQQARAGGGTEALGAEPGRNAFDEFRRVEESIENAEFSVDAERDVQEMLAPRPGLEQEFARLEQSALAIPGETSSNDAAGTQAPVGKPRVRID
jgi:phage shock protein A